MIAAVECAGAPRDLGRDQGEACAAGLARRFARVGWVGRARYWFGRVDPEAARVERSLWRDFPHQAEWLAGLAVGAGVPRAWLVSELPRLRHDPVVAAVLRAPTPRLFRGLDGEWILRRNRPEGLFASVDVARPGVPAPLVGVNERGLAVALVTARTPREAAPAWLLARDCIERFERVDAALAWCRARPGARGGALLLADAAGEGAAVQLDEHGGAVRPVGGRIVHGGAEAVAAVEAALADAPEDIAALAKRFEGAAVDAAARCLAVGGERFSP